MMMAPDGVGSSGVSEPPLGAAPPAVTPPAPDAAAAAAAAAQAKAEADAKAAADKAAAEKAAAAAPPRPTGENGARVMTREALRKMGEDTARKANEKLAKEMGFGTVDEMKAAFQKNAERAAAEAEQARARRPAAATAEQRQQQLQAERDEFAKKAAAESRAARRAQEEVEHTKAEMQTREQFIRNGVVDIDVAKFLFEKHLDEIEEDEIEEYNKDFAGKMSALLEGWKKTKPYLFNRVEVPATTGPGGGTPKPPPAGSSLGAAADGGKVDCSKMTPEEFQQYLAKQGIGDSAAAADMRGVRAASNR